MAVRCACGVPLVGQGIMGRVSALAIREPADWVEDMTWHRRMFRQSKFRWVPDDAMSIALSWTRGRLVYDTPAHLRLVDEQLLALKGFACGIDDAMLAPLTEARQRSGSADWKAGLELVGLTPLDIEILRHSALSTPRDAPLHREARRAIHGIPWSNPFSQVWELRQMRGMYAAAENLLEDAFCDLALELAPEQGWHNLSQLTLRHRSARTLQHRVEDQRVTRGEPGDPRREPVQRY